MPNSQESNVEKITPEHRIRHNITKTAQSIINATKVKNTPTEKTEACIYGLYASFNLAQTILKKIKCKEGFDINKTAFMTIISQELEKLDAIEFGENNDNKN